METYTVQTARDYAWDSVPSIADLDAEQEHTSPERRVTRETETCESGRPPDPIAIVEGWRAQHVDVASQMMLVHEELQRTSNAGLRSTALVGLRRAAGVFAVLYDSLQDVQLAARDTDARIDPEAAIVRYVDCVFWWTSRLLSAIEDALHDAAGSPSRIGAALVEAAEFAALYSHAHIAPLFGACDLQPADALGEALARLQADVAWLTWQLNDLAEG